MERRDFIRTAGLFVAGSAVVSHAGMANAAEAPAAKAASNNVLRVQSPGILKLLPAFNNCAALCSSSADLCVQHCDELIARGETAFTKCSIASAQMSVMCTAAGKLAAMKSVRLMEILDSCASACKACKEACEEHKAHWKMGMHLECKTCAEHCDKMLAQIAALKKAA